MNFILLLESKKANSTLKCHFGCLWQSRDKSFIKQIIPYIEQTQGAFQFTHVYNLCSIVCLHYENSDNWACELLQNMFCDCADNTRTLGHIRWCTFCYIFSYLLDPRFSGKKKENDLLQRYKYFILCKARYASMSIENLTIPEYETILCL